VPHKAKPPATDEPHVRLDKWLWAARFYKTRSLATDEIGLGRVRVNGADAKASREVRVGDCIELRQHQSLRTVHVRGLSHVRGPAPVAALLYLETAESVDRRQHAAEQRRLAPEPAQTLPQGRPTKRDRRTLDGYKQGAKAGWNDRWSASLDPDL
jgi:ribosome-associated heat shock protein Hsp15